MISVYTLIMTKSPATKPLDPVEFETCTCANLRKATRAVTQEFDAALKPVGLKATQFSVLATLASRGDAPLTRLADALVMDRTTLTRNLKPLVKKGLIRIDHEADQRIRKVSLSETGKRVLGQARPHWERAQLRLVDKLGQARWSGFLTDLSATVAVVRGR
jgi:DNA-binding MarR family transcriptional regulator